LAITERTDGDPTRLSADVRELLRADWMPLAAGSLEEADAFEAMLTGLGWALTDLDPDPAVRLPTGSVYTFERVDDSISHWVWEAGAETAAENDGLFVAAGLAWDAYVPAVSVVAGPPGSVSAWDDPAFPALDRWDDPEIREVERDPFRLARWTVPAGELLLWVNVFTGTATRRRAGGVSVVSELLLPAGSLG
jgi:hypothetical protein